MWCPSCYAEYRDDFSRCIDCEVDLVDTPGTGNAHRSPSAIAPVVLGVVGLLLAPWPVLFFAGWGLGIAAIRVGTRAGLRNAARRGKRAAATSGVVIGTFAVVVGCGSLLRLIGYGDTRNDTRAEVIESLVRDQRIPREVAECAVNGAKQNGIKPGDDLRDASEKQIKVILRVALDCEGAGSVSDCVIDALFQVLPKSAQQNGAGFLRAMDELNSEDRMWLTESGFVCQGVPAPVARCVTSSMVKAFGRGIFDSARLELTSEQQKTLQRVQAACVVSSA